MAKKRPFKIRLSDGLGPSAYLFPPDEDHDLVSPASFSFIWRCIFDLFFIMALAYTPIVIIAIVSVTCKSILGLL